MDELVRRGIAGALVGMHLLIASSGVRVVLALDFNAAI
jgi:hypothetical protein